MFTFPFLKTTASYMGSSEILAPSGCTLVPLLLLWILGVLLLPRCLHHLQFSPYLVLHGAPICSL